jgi:ubiquinone/menaquinone biosynthesis C-methylase UbiE
MSIVFDRAVEFYDQTRALDPKIMDAALDALVRETDITRASRVLEIGVGTGRIALPLSERVASIFGVDLSFGMMGVLQNKLRVTPRAVLPSCADVLELPFRAGTFNLVYAVHVLHLVSGWQNAVVEAMRVLAPGGHFAVNYHKRHPEMPNVILRKRLQELVAPYGVSTQRPGAQSDEEIYNELGKWDSASRVIGVLDWTEPDTPNQMLREIEQQIHSETWAIPRSVMDEVVPQLRVWAHERFGDLDKAYDAQFSFDWLIAKKK